MIFTTLSKISMKQSSSSYSVSSSSSSNQLTDHHTVQLQQQSTNSMCRFNRPSWAFGYC
ncbi:hypothetical protein DFA_02979 [Cavenderia fasciculata]|uniref:Uncharacterized protein n=1 Tax=Cavenderia fasciculata TaxID=261658 RepID=F4PGA1_CACFS|nr:uncharacterized protein DFA_02979 [Cavenderia fasciculata]EGG24735.1 hypothetical protein DFA_02979 [Cavenderia fasciculata]|eukprot:XP_004362586.1 hypothetical protein DFA_02979 [Cavenderia fasciculata]